MATDKRRSLRSVDGRAGAAETIKQQTYAQLVGGSSSSSSLKAARTGAANDGFDAYSRSHTNQMAHPPQQPPGSREHWRRSFQDNSAVFNLSHRSPRRASMLPGSASGQQRYRPRMGNHDASAAATLVAHKRMSLDSIHYAAASRRIINEHLEAGGHVPSQYLDSISEFGQPMWSNEQLRRARRFSSSHTRGSSCPTLNITRIMRSISVSSGSSSSSSTISSGTREAHALAKKARRHYSMAPEPAACRSECSSLRTHGCSSYDRSSNNKNSASASASSDGSSRDTASDDQGADQSQTVQAQAHSPSLAVSSSSYLNRASGSTSETRIPPRIIVDGLRRRTTVGRHEAGTPDLVVRTDDLSSPLSPPLTEETYLDAADAHGEHAMPLDALYQLGATGASATPSISSATSSARWSTISAESPHKRYSYSSAAIAEALRNLQSASRNSNISLGEPSHSYQPSTSPLPSSDPTLLRTDGGIIVSSNSSNSSSNSNNGDGSGSGSGADEKMTITLKGPPRRQEDAQTNSGSTATDEAVGREQRGSENTHSVGSGDIPENVSGGSNGFKSFPRLDNGGSYLENSSGRPSTDGMRSSGEAPIPAIYLDGTASLWDQYMAELDSSEFDGKIHLKRQRVSQFLRVPWNVEKLLWFGVAICFDALIYVFSILPAKFVRAVLTLAASAFYELPELIDDACASTIAQLVLQALPGTWSGRALAGGRKLRHWACRIVGRQSDGSSGATSAGSTTSSSDIGRNMSRWLSPAQLFDLYRGLLLIFTCLALCRIDAAQMYHSIRAQSSLKLYFIFSALDIFDRLLSSFGHDVLDALQSTVTDPRSQRWKTGAGYFALAQAYMLVHTLVLFYQVITLNVAVNAYSDQLLSLLISNQFVEIKSNVFKKWEKEMLFQVACADIAERFQEIVFLFIIILRNLAELSGTGISPLFDASPATASASGGAATVVPTVQPPVSFDSATPSAFGPLIPTWVSVPLINRILTPILMVLGTEILIDWIKHAFVTKLNWIRPEIYSHYIDILSRDLACSKSGVRARGVLPLVRGGSRLAPLEDVPESASDADEKIDGSYCARGSVDAGENGGSLARTRSSSILVHAALRAIAWVQANLLPEPRAVHGDSQQLGPDGASGAGRPPSSSSGAAASYGRRRGHRRVQSVTQPQIFVEQSSRVARRIGLSPMPLACLITLMLMQVAHILMQSSGLGYSGAPTPSVPEPSPIEAPWLLGWLMAVPVLGFGVRALAAACKIAYSLLSMDALSHLGYLVVHPRKAVSLAFAAFFASSGDSLWLAAPTGWALLDVVGWAAIVLIAYALVVWAKLT
ncbi:hypothetical protein LPJ75_001013, partial [Coemansia sp. RSA 2598]